MLLSLKLTPIQESNQEPIVVNDYRLFAFLVQVPYMPLTGALSLFLLDCQSRRLTRSTLAFYHDKAGRFIMWLADGDITHLESITSVHIKRYMVSLRDRGLTDHSQHDYARVVRTFLAYCIRGELIAKSPFTRVKMPRVAEDLPTVLSDEEIRSTLQRVKLQRNRLIIRFILDSGVRASELLALNAGDVDIDNGVVTVHRGKQQKARLTSVGAITRKELKRYLLSRGSPDAKAPLITTESDDKRLSFMGLMSVFRKMQHESGVLNLTAHTLRRIMATKSLENGMDAWVLARLLGHADLQMLRKYVRLNKQPVVRASELYSVVDSLD